MTHGRMYLTASDIYLPAMVALLAALILFILVVPAALAVDVPAYVTCRIEAAMSAEDLGNIIVEEYEGTLVLKGMVWNGDVSWLASSEDDEEDDEEDEGETDTLCWDDDMTTIATGTVQIRGVLLTQGTAEDFLENPGILWLQYAFSDTGGNAAGTAEGFVSLEEIEEMWGSSSFQGTAHIDGQDLMFFGTGMTHVSPFFDNPEEEGSSDGITAGNMSLGLIQAMGQTVLTVSKPGFAFETAGSLTQLERRFSRASRHLQRQRIQRRRVLEAVTGP